MIAGDFGLLFAVIGLALAYLAKRNEKKRLLLMEISVASFVCTLVAVLTSYPNLSFVQRIWVAATLLCIVSGIKAVLRVRNERK